MCSLKIQRFYLCVQECNFSGAASLKKTCLPLIWQPLMASGSSARVGLYEPLYPLCWISTALSCIGLVCVAIASVMLGKYCFAPDAQYLVVKICLSLLPQSSLNLEAREWDTHVLFWAERLHRLLFSEYWQIVGLWVNHLLYKEGSLIWVERCTNLWEWQ